MKKKKGVSLLTLAAFCTTLWPTALFAAPHPVTAMQQTPVSLIVELEAPPVLAQNAAVTHNARATADSSASQAEAEIRAGQAAVLDDIAALMEKDAAPVQTTNSKGSEKATSTLEPSATFTHVVNGFVIECDSALKDDIEKLPGVKAVYRNMSHTITPPEEARQDTQTTDGNDMNTQYMHDQGYRGEGQVVAIIDTELDAQHEMFAGEVANPALSKEEVALALKDAHLNIEASVDEVYRSSKLPFVYNYLDHSSDTYTETWDVIHGSHVAGIAAGRGGHALDGAPLSGIAPEAQILFFSLSEKDESIISDALVLTALDDSVKLGADVVNISLGTDSAIAVPLFEEAFENAANAGIYIVASAGNSSRLYALGAPAANQPDYFTLCAPAKYTSTTAVASADVSHTQYTTYPLCVEGTSETPHYAEISTNSFTEVIKDGTYDTVYCGTGTSEDCADKDLDGKIAVIEYGQTFENIYENILAGGAIGLMLIHNTDSYSNIDFYINPTPLPTALLLPQDADLFREKNQHITTDAEHAQIETLTSPVAPSYFSSWGVATDLVLNPDISAPGNVIYSSIPSASHDSYASFCGTSMAAPQITGAVALLKQAIESNPNRYSNADLNSLIQNLMMSTATVMTNDEGVAYSPRQQGAGNLNLKAATETPVILLGDDGKSKLSLGNDIGDRFTFSLTAQNLSDKDVTYDALEVSVNGDDVNADGLVEGVTPLKTSRIALPDAVTVPAGGSATIDVRIDLDKSAMKERMKVFTNGFFVDGYVTLATTDGSVPEVHLPFTGFYGDWAAMTAMDAPYYSKDSAMEMTGLGSTIQGLCLTRLGTEDFIYSLNNPDIPFYQLFEFPVNGHADAYSAISPNGDDIIDELQVLIQPLREMTDFTVLLKDSKGKTLYEENHEDVVFKSSLNILEVPQDVIDSLPDGDYQVTVSGRFNYEGAESETITMPFAVDRTAPTVEEWQLNEDGTLTITATDDRAIMGAIAFSEDAAGQAHFTDAIAIPEDDTLTLDLTDMNLDTLEVSVWDYAGNTWTAYGKDGSLFADVPTDAWYADAVAYVSSNGLMVGVKEGKFAPMMTTTRAQLVTTLWRLAGEPKAAHSMSFSDISDTAYYTDAVAWAAEEGIAAGFGDGKFHPNDALSREQLAAFLMKFADATGLDTDARENLSDYTDVKKSDWSYDTLAWAKAEGLLGGTTATTMQPKATANRAQLAAVLQRYCTNMAAS